MTEIKEIKKGKLYYYTKFNEVECIFVQKDLTCNKKNTMRKLKDRYFLEIMASPYDNLTSLHVKPDSYFLSLDENPIECLFIYETAASWQKSTKILFYRFLYENKIYFILKDSVDKGSFSLAE